MLSAYGLRFGFEDGAENVDVQVLPPETGDSTLAGDWTGSRAPAEAAVRWVDGDEFRVERGRDGDLFYCWGDSGQWLLASDGNRLRGWSAEAPPGPRWWRVLFDSVMAGVALAHGREALHAGAVVVADRGVAIAAAQGGGKTSLVAELLARGYPLVADDVLMVESDGPDVLCHPAPPLLNLPYRAGGPGDVGMVLAALGDEDWVLIPLHSEHPVELGAICILERRDGQRLRVESAAPSPMLLTPHLLDSGAAPERRRSRFEMLADLAERVPVLTVSAPLEGAPPAVIADALLEALA